jgi:hypothetical protein
MFEPKVPKCVVKINFIDFNSFSLLIINIRILLNFENECYTFNMEKKHLKKNCLQSIL